MKRLKSRIAVLLIVAACIIPFLLFWLWLELFLDI
jgi:hypothetical protein